MLSPAFADRQASDLFFRRFIPGRFIPGDALAVRDTNGGGRMALCFSCIGRFEKAARGSGQGDQPETEEAQEVPGFAAFTAASRGGGG